MAKEGMIYRVGDQRLFLPLNSLSFEFTRALNKLDAKNCEIVFGVSIDSEEKPISQIELSAAADRLARLIEKQLNRRYLLTYELLGFKFEDAENAPSVQIDGEYFDISAGLGRCLLTRKRWLEQGYFEDISEVDISDKLSITLDSGVCKISRKNVDTSSALEPLTTIKNFADSMSSSESIYYSLIANFGDS